MRKAKISATHIDETLQLWKQMIGQCLAVELFDVLKHKKPYDNERYIKNLLALPKEPFD